MAVSRNNSAKKTAAVELEKKKRRRALLALVLLLLFIAALGFALFGAGRLLFADNPCFRLRELRIDGAGYWKEHQEELAKQIKLEMGINLFTLDLRTLRQKVRKIPNVDSCSILRVLPDTLVFQITERVPRAFLSRANSPWVVDSNGIIMPRKQVMSSFSQLPVISDISLSGAKIGQPLKGIRPAIELVMMTVHNFPDFKIHRISMTNPDKMEIYLQYQRFPIYQVRIPVKNRGLSFALLALQSAIVNARETGEKRTHYDLSYDNRVVIY